MFERYDELKEQNPESILLFRVGDFYEAYHDDAVTCSKLLGLTLTTMRKSSRPPTKMTGFPYHSLEAYVAKLVKERQRVAICEPVEPLEVTSCP